MDSFFNLWAIRFDPERGRPVGDAMPVTNFDSPRMSISPYVNVNDFGVSAQRAVLPMRNECRIESLPPVMTPVTEGSVTKRPTLSLAT